MNDTDRQELRDWLAKELMELTIINPEAPRWLQHFTSGYLVDNYRPDSPDSPASQIIGVIEAMKGRGFQFGVKSWGDFFMASFGKGRFRDMNLGLAEADTLLDAVCLAARAAVEGNP